MWARAYHAQSCVDPVLKLARYHSWLGVRFESLNSITISITSSITTLGDNVLWIRSPLAIVPLANGWHLPKGWQLAHCPSVGHWLRVGNCPAGQGLTQVGPKLGPSWAQVGPSRPKAQVGHFPKASQGPKCAKTIVKHCIFEGAAKGQNGNPLPRTRT